MTQDHMLRIVTCLVIALIAAVSAGGIVVTIIPAGFDTDIADHGTPMPGAYTDAGSNEAATRDNRAPQLSWTGEENFEADGLDPSEGVETDVFEFHVTYTDLDNDPPAAINVSIDGNLYPMTTRDTVFVDGSIFTFSLNNLTRGRHTYYFETTDGKNQIVRLPRTGYLSGPEVNSKPQLILPVDGGVVPDEGVTSTMFLFQVIYMDEDNDPALTREVIIDNKPYRMSPTPGEGVYHNNKFDDGELFQASVQLGIGTHKYQFHFVDDRNGENYTTLTSASPVVLPGYPDISILPEDITFTLNQTDPLETITITATVRNIGGGKIDHSFYVTFFNGSFDGVLSVRPPIQTESYLIPAGLPSGGSYTITTEFTPGAIGTYDIYVAADIDLTDPLTEIYHNATIVSAYPGFSDELIDFSDPNTNNMAQRQLIVGPDLQVIRQEIQPHAALTRRPIIIGAMLYNVGSTIINEEQPINVTFAYKIKNSDADVLVPIGSQQVKLFDHDMLLPGKGRVINTTWTPTTPGDYEIYVIVDASENGTGIIAEVVELTDSQGEKIEDTNNEAYTNLRVSNPLPATTPSFAPAVWLIIAVLGVLAMMGYVMDHPRK